MIRFCTAFLFIIFLAGAPIYAQNEANEWMFGWNCWVSFASGQPVVRDSVPLKNDEGCASVCDENGKLLFYTDTRTVWNAQHEQMPNGFNLIASAQRSSTQGVVIVPNPKYRNIYYIFSSADRTNASSSSEFQYAIVNMDLDGGKGDVQQKNIILIKNNISECIGATFDCSGEGFWVITHSENGNIFYSFHVDSAGVDTDPEISDFKNDSEKYIQPFLKISPNTKKIALTSNTETYNSFASAAALRLYDFDNEKGIVSNMQNIMNGSKEGCYGLTFSPDNSKLYVGQQEAFLNRYIDSSIAQFDISLMNEFAIRASKVNLPRKLAPTAMQIAPDGKIYIPLGYSLAAIEKPNLAGKTCSYVDNAVLLKKFNTRLGLPNFPDIYFQQGKRNLTCAVPKGIFTFDTVCAGNVVHYSEATDNFPETWKWFFEGGEPAAFEGQNPPPVFYEKGGNFTTTLVTHNFFGYDTLKRTVLVRELPYGEAGPDITLCSGGSARLGTEAVAGNVYRWSPEQGLDNPTIAQPIASPAVTTRYFLRVTDGFGCESVDSVLVTVGTVKAATAPQNDTICFGNSVVLTASGGSEYEWSPATGLSAFKGASVTATPLQTTTYRVIASGGGVCYDTTFVTVNVWKAPEDIAGRDRTICEGDSSELGFKENNRAEYYYTWTPTTGLSNPNIANPFAAPNATTKYFVRVANSSGECFAEDSVTVAVLAAPVVTSYDTTLCVNQKGMLRVECADPNVTYSWSPAAGLSDPASPTPIVTAFKTQVYTVTVTNSSGCPTKKQVTLTVTEKDVFKAVLTTEKPTVGVGENAAITLHLQSSTEAQGMTSFKARVTYDPAVFQYTDQSAKFLQGADNSWNIAAQQTAQGELQLEGNGTTPIFETGIQFVLTAYLADQTQNDITVELQKMNGDSVASETLCQRIETTPASLLLNDVCGGDMRLVKLGQYQTFLKAPSPNPVTADVAEIHYSLGIEGTASMMIYDEKGNLVKTVFKKYSRPGVFKENVDIDGFSSGVYFIRFVTPQAVFTQKLMIEK